MAGIYFHIPFCKQACHYCDFHFSTSLRTKDALLNAMHRELEERKGELKDEVSTIYFGGGTPSLLEKEELGSLIYKTKSLFQLTSDVEICLEANPDDLSAKKLAELKEIGIERLSIGLQSFSEQRLKDLNRAHSAQESLNCIELSNAAGFQNINIDLIYALPGQNEEDWKGELQQAIDLDIQHISAYCLTVEPGTALHHFVKKGKVLPANNETEERHFEIAMDLLTNAGFDHYEISNFGKPGFWSRHNTSYWKGEPYLGVGPSAHSFNGELRRWNLSNNVRYINAIKEGMPYFDEEILSAKDRFNEALMLGLRTSWGINLVDLQKETGIELNTEQTTILAQSINEGYLKTEGGVVALTQKGKLIADRLASDLFAI